MPNSGILIVVTGPTGVGKTKLAIDLAKFYGTEIISADSRQIYKELHIGTAAPTPEEMQNIPHHFVQSISIYDYYNASMFEMDVLQKLEKLFAIYPVVIMAGGSTLYVDGVCYGIDDLPTIDLSLRDELKKQYSIEGIDFLRYELQKLDPVHYERVDKNNPNRMMKAIEVCRMTGRTYSSLLTATQKKRNFEIIRIGLDRDRTELFSRINDRVDEMMQQGFLEEAQSLIHARHTNALQTVGYRDLFEYLDGKISLDMAVEKCKISTRRYAKRQLTWFKRDGTTSWFHPENVNTIMQYLRSRI